MGNTTEKQQVYKEYINNNQNQIDLTSLDPYTVLNVPKNFTWEQLKEAYKQAAIKTHPDKPGGNKLVFDFVTQCFKTLAEEYRGKKYQKSHIDLKKESQNYLLKPPVVNNRINEPTELNEPFEKKFNKVFNECKYKDEETDYGYGDKMTSSLKIREDINIDNIFNKNNVDNKTFNEKFNKSVPVIPKSKDMIKYKEPEPLPAAKNLQFTEIGSKRPDDYSSSIEKKSLIYTDYMRAYDGMRLANSDEIKSRKDFKNLEEYEKYRDKIVKKVLSEKERKYMEELKELEEKREYERQERLKKQNIEIQKAYERANQYLIR